MHLLSFLVSLGMVYQAIGVTIVQPSNGAEWTSTGKVLHLHINLFNSLTYPFKQGPNFISWTYKSGDPKNLTFQLLHDNNSTFEPIPNLLTANGIVVSGVDLTSSVIEFTPSW